MLVDALAPFVFLTRNECERITYCSAMCNIYISITPIPSALSDRAVIPLLFKLSTNICLVQSTLSLAFTKHH